MLETLINLAVKHGPTFYKVFSCTSLTSRNWFLSDSNKSSKILSGTLQDLQNNSRERDRSADSAMSGMGGLLQLNGSLEENSFLNKSGSMGGNEVDESNRYQGREPFTAPRRRSAKPVTTASSFKNDAMWSRLAHYVHIENRHTSSNVDIVSRILFPIGFLLFNFAYWLTIVFKFRS